MKLIRVTNDMSEIFWGEGFTYLPTPAQFLYIIKNAKYVITDSFHGTCFCINFNKNFIDVLPENHSQRNRSVLDFFNSIILIFLCSINILLTFDQSILCSTKSNLSSEIKMRLVCEKDICTGCNACVNVCHKNAVTIVDTYKEFNAYIDEDKCINCNMCMNVCPNRADINMLKPQKWLQGWTENEFNRKMSASGGVATAIASSFLKSGGMVCSCVYERGAFIYKMISDEMMLDNFRGSKYVKSNPGMIYIDIMNALKENNKILFIGLPCHVAALKKYMEVRKQNIQNLYTIDLICHGSPSPNILFNYLKNKKIEIGNIYNINFRQKNLFGLSVNNRYIKQKGTYDGYTLAFLRGLIYTNNCYQCRYATDKRISDITLGDSWGSDLADIEKKKGISLILCQTYKGEMLLSEADIATKDVEQEKAIESNGQLKAPFKKSKEYYRFWNNYNKDNLDYSVFLCFPVKCIKQRIKAIIFL